MIAMLQQAVSRAGRAAANGLDHATDAGSHASSRFR